MKTVITKAQIKAIINLRDDAEAQIGTAETFDGFNADDNWTKQIKLIDRFLLKNNIDANDYR